MPELTPMMRQYVRVKEQHPDAIVFFRLGDFYEMFRSDAIEASRLLGLTLTSRQGVPMCGVPHHSSTRYIARLINHGKRVAICEQVTVPEGKGIADRQVVEVITPATVTQEDYLPDANNFLLSVARDTAGVMIAFLDVSTGELGLAELARDEPWIAFARELARLEPREVLVQQSMLEDERAARALESADTLTTTYPDWEYDLSGARDALARTLGVANLKAFGIDEASHLPLPAGVLLNYVKETTRGPLRHVRDLRVTSAEPRVGLDENTIRNLELVANMHDATSRFSLLETLRDTRTAMGARLLRQWILSPLTDLDRIAGRQDEVGALKASQALLGRLRERLGSILDLERLTARLSMGRAHAKDLVAIRTTLASTTELRTLIEDANVGELRFTKEIDAELLQSIMDLETSLHEALLDEPSTALTEGRMIRPGYSAELDRFRDIQENSRAVLEAYVAEEREKTGISTIRVRQNRVLGHFLELSRNSAEKAPDYFVRRQSLANSERFTTERLTEIESEIEAASERIVELERELFLAVRARAEERIPELLRVARSLARLDSLQSMASVASQRGYVRPEMINGPRLNIIAGRHPVVEAHLPPGEFVPNDVRLGDGRENFALITGPNMAGKSTYLRQTALIALMAQIGSFVPAESAEIGVVDRIFCRVGASDNLARGESTFLVEMNEAAYILRTSTPQSLVIMDEIGRGTSTNDGLAIAQAIMEHLVAHDRPRTLFATHFHELTALPVPVQNLSMSVAEHGNEIVFLKRVQDGPSNNSYGIHVARLAGVPSAVIERASEILATLIESEQQKPAKLAPKGDQSPPQAPLFDPVELIRAELGEIDLNQMRPVDALARLSRWQDELRESGEGPERQ